MGNKVIEGNLNVLGTIQQNGAPVAGCEIITLPSGDEGTLQSEVLAKLVANPFGFILHQPSRDAVYFEYIGTVNEHTLIYKAPIKALTTGVYEYEFRVNDTTGDWAYREASYSVDIPVGMTVLELNADSGLLTDEQNELVKGNNCIIKKGVYFYYKFEQQPTMVRYYKKCQYTYRWDNADLYFEQFHINTKTKYYSFYSNIITVYKILPNQALTGEETDLSALKIGSTNYRIAPAVNPSSIADAYDNTATYKVGDYCFYNNTLYICSTAVETAEDFDDTKWTAIELSAQIKDWYTISITKASGTLSVEDFNKLKKDPLYTVFERYGNYFYFFTQNSTYIRYLIYNQLFVSSSNTVNLPFAEVRVQVADGYYQVLYPNGTLVPTDDRAMYLGGKGYEYSTSVTSGDTASSTLMSQVRQKYNLIVNDVRYKFAYTNNDIYYYFSQIDDVLKVMIIDDADDSITLKDISIGGQGVSGDELEVIPYQTTTPLTDAQVEKAKVGKLAIFVNTSDEKRFLYPSGRAGNICIWFSSFNAGTAAGTTVPSYNIVEKYQCRLDLSTKLLSEFGASVRTESVAYTENNFISDFTTPAATGKQIIRAQNLRRTQDMICQDYYSPSSTYSIGDVVIYENKLYECSTDISVAEAWDSTHWTQLSTIDAIKRFPNIGYIEVNSTSGTLTAEQLVELNKPICIIKASTYGTCIRTAGETDIRWATATLFDPSSMFTSTINSRRFVINTNTNRFNIYADSNNIYQKEHIDAFLANRYSETNIYNKNDYVIYNNKLYKCNTAITTAEAWNSAHWTAVQVGEELNSKSDIEVVDYADYTAENSLSDAQVEKAKAGKLYIKNSPYGLAMPIGMSSELVLYRSYSNSQNTGQYIPTESLTESPQIVLWISTKKLTQQYKQISTILSDNAGNFLTSPDIPTLTDKRLVRGLNLRRTQDMINEDIYDNTATYAVDDIVIYENNLYICKTAVTTAEDFDSTKWEKTSIIKLIKDIKSQL